MATGEGGSPPNQEQSLPAEACTSAASGSPKETGADRSGTAVVLSPALMKKSRVKWDGAGADFVCARVVANAGAHLAKWEEGDGLYAKDAELFNAQQNKPFKTNSKHIMGQFMLLKERFEREEAALAKQSGTEENQDELSVLLEEAAPIMNNARLAATKAKENRSTVEEELSRARVAARDALLKRRTHRNDMALNKTMKTNDVEDESNGDELSPATKRRRRREHAEEEKDNGLVELIKRDAAERRDVERRNCATVEKRLDLDQRRFQRELDNDAERRQRDAAAEIARAKAAANAAATSMTDREERVQTLALIAELARIIKKD